MADREFSSAPSILPLFARAGVAMIPGAARLPFVGGGGGEISDRALTLNDVEIDRDRLAGYDRVCGFDVGDTLPATYPHMLAFPLHLALMTDASFPFPAIGLVHIANEIVQHRPIDARERLSLRVWASGSEPHPRGRQFSIHSEARVADELVWEEVSTNLRRGGGADEPAPTRDTPPSPGDTPPSPGDTPPSPGDTPPSPGDTPPSPGNTPPSSEDLPASATWSLKGDLGRRYGAVSGDLNPIHVHSLTARLFGFPTAIAHGMWTKARCLAALGPELPAAFSVRVAFKRPILLPATVQFAEAAPGGGVDEAPAGRGVDEAPARRGVDEAPVGHGQIAFGVRDAKRATPHLDGLVTP